MRDEMCESCRLPSDDAGLSRLVKLRLLLLALVAAAAAVAVVADGIGPRSQSDRAAAAVPLAAERVFLADITRQSADALQLRMRARRFPALAALAGAIEREDRGIAGGAAVASAAPVQGHRAGSLPALRRAIRRHVDQDRLIARVELATGTDPAAKQAATRLLRESRRWIVGLHVGRARRS
jgi:hypothetical protein